MDFPSHDELMANKHDGNIEKMRQWLDVDSLGYLSLKGLSDAVASANPSAKGFCDACFSSNYPVPVEHGVEKDENDW